MHETKTRVPVKKWTGKNKNKKILSKMHNNSNETRKGNIRSNES